QPRGEPFSCAPGPRHVWFDAVGERVLVRGAGGIIHPAPDEGFFLLEVATGRVMRNFPALSWEPAQAFLSPDGKHVATRTDPQTVTLWQVDRQAPLATLRHERPVLHLAASRDGKTLATVDAGEVRFWSVDTGRPVGKALRPFQQPFRLAEFSPDQV